MLQLLLFNRQVNSWDNAKVSAQAVFTVLAVMKHKGALSLPTSYQINWAGEQKKLSFEPMDWTEDLQFVKTGTAITPAAYSATITKQGVLTDFASLSAVYQTDNAKPSAEGVINLTRQYFVRLKQDGETKLRPVEDLDEIKADDEVEVHLTLRTDSAFEYVLLQDPRPAGFENEELLSGWDWNPISFYKEIRDGGTNFFINWVPAGDHPLKPELGTRKIAFSNTVYIDKADFSMTPPPKYQRLKPDGYVRLKGAYIVHCDEVVMDENGEVTEVKCSYIPESRSSNDTSGLKVRGTIQWVDGKTGVDAEIRKYAPLLKDAEYAGQDFTERMNLESEKIFQGKAEPYLAESKDGEQFQLMRVGYYKKCVDENGKLVLSEIVSLKDNFNK